MPSILPIIYFLESFWRRNKEELKKESQSADAFGSRKLTYSDTAITFQFVFHNIALVVQGILLFYR